jgi:membrane-associated phospholipid phosphatase
MALPEKKNKVIEDIAHYLTVFLSPLTAVAVGVSIIYVEFVPHSITNLITWLSIMIGAMGLGIGIMILYKKLGHISSWDIVKREQRPRVFVIFFFIMVMVVIAALLFGFEIAAQYLILSTIGFGLAFLITVYWKISIHAFAMALTVLLILQIYPYPAALPLLVLPIITAWTRVYLKKHTFLQVVGGILLAVWVHLLWRIFKFDVSSLQI